MQPRIIHPKKGPEAIIQQEIIHMLENRGWYCMATHGNLYQSGFPDIFATHNKFGSRWVEVKVEGRVVFTARQLECFPKMNAHGTGVWVLTAASENQYLKLFQPCNWYFYLMKL